jgi:hypothetical protein
MEERGMREGVRDTYVLKIAFFTTDQTHFSGGATKSSRLSRMVLWS